MITDEEICRAFATEPDGYDEQIVSASSGRQFSEGRIERLLSKIYNSIVSSAIFRWFIHAVRDRDLINCEPELSIIRNIPRSQR
jgi:hypothetical protein